MFFFYHKHIRALRAFVPKNRQRQGFAQTVVSAYRVNEDEIQAPSERLLNLTAPY